VGGGGDRGCGGRDRRECVWGGSVAALVLTLL
jgi:hypothetical protein